MTIAEVAARMYKAFGDERAVQAAMHKDADSHLLARIEAQRALIAYRAGRAEIADPEPRVLPAFVCCPDCWLYRLLPSEAKPPMALERLS